MSLDDRFGECLEAGRPIEPHELTRSPNSLIELTQETAKSLIDFMTAFDDHLSPFVRNYHILWLVDQAGRLRVAFEEVIDPSGVTIGALAKPIGARPISPIKLGHPSLLGLDEPKNARIGGEIIFDPDFDGQHKWVLTNKSGRYGLRAGQTEKHLVNAVGLFASLGLYLSHWFTPPLGG